MSSNAYLSNHSVPTASPTITSNRNMKQQGEEEASNLLELDLAQKPGNYFSACLGLKEFENKKVDVKKNNYSFRIKNSFNEFAYSVKTDMNKIFMRNVNRNKLSSLMKNKFERSTLITSFQTNLIKNLDKEKDQNTIGIINEIKTSLDTIKDINLIANKNNLDPDKLKKIKEKIILLLNKLSEKISKEKQIEFQNLQIDLTILSDKIINGFTSSSNKHVDSCFEISKKMWDLISYKNDHLKGLDSMGAQLLFVLGSFLSYSPRSSSEKACIYIKRVSVPFIFALHEFFSYILTMLAANPFITAISIGATGGSILFGAIVAFGSFVYIHKLAHTIEHYEEDTESEAAKNRKKLLRDLYLELNLNEIANNLTPTIGNQNEVLKELRRFENSQLFNNKCNVLPESLKNIRNITREYNKPKLLKLMKKIYKIIPKPVRIIVKTFLKILIFIFHPFIDIIKFGINNLPSNKESLKKGNEEKISAFKSIIYSNWAEFEILSLRGMTAESNIFLDSPVEPGNDKSQFKPERSIAQGHSSSANFSSIDESSQTKVAIKKEDIANLFKFAHISINNSNSDLLADNNLFITAKRIASSILSTKINGVTSFEAEQIQEYLVNNLIYFCREMAKNEMPTKYKILKFLAQGVAFETTDFALDYTAVLGTMKLEAALTLQKHLKTIIINVANIGLQLGILIPFCLALKIPQNLIANQFTKWEKKYIYEPNDFVLNFIISSKGKLPLSS